MSDNTQPSKLIDIDNVFEQKNPVLKKYIPGFLIKYLKRITHQEEINEFIANNAQFYGVDYAEAIVKNFGARYIIQGKETYLKKEDLFLQLITLYTANC